MNELELGICICLAFAGGVLVGMLIACSRPYRPERRGGVGGDQFAVMPQQD